MKTEVVEESSPVEVTSLIPLVEVPEQRKRAMIKEQLLEALSERNYSTSSLTYSKFIAQAVEKVLG